MSGGGIPSANAVPGAEQDSLYSNDSSNHFQANQLGKHGGFMQENATQSTSPRIPPNPYGMDNQSSKAAGNAGHFLSGQSPQQFSPSSQGGAQNMYNMSGKQQSSQMNTRQPGSLQGFPQHPQYPGNQTPKQPQSNYTQNTNASLPNGPPLRGTPSPSSGTGHQQNGPKMGPSSFSNNGPTLDAGSSSSFSLPPSNPGMVKPQQGLLQNPIQQRSTPSPSSRQYPPHVEQRQRQPMEQMHSTSAFMPVAGSHPQQPIAPSSRSPQQPTSTVSTTPSGPATLPVSSGSGPTVMSQSRSQHSTPSPQPLSALHSGKPKRPGIPVGPGSSYPGQSGIPQRSTPPSSGPPTPSGTSSASIQGSVPPAGGNFPGSGQDSSASRPSLTSKRRQYPTQPTPSLPPGGMANMSNPAGQGFPGQMSGQMPSQIPGQMTGQIPGQIPGQMPGQMPPQMPGIMPGHMTPQMPYPAGARGQAQPGYMGLQGQMDRLTLQQPAGVQPINLMEQRHIVPSAPIEHPVPPLSSDLQKRNGHSSVLCCTLNSVPETKSLLTKSRLPFAIHLHPFKDLQSLPVIHSSVITRCRSCRTYINPFVTFTESRRWRCPMCFRTNDVPEEFCYDPSTKSYGDPSRRPEIKSSTVEFIAPSEYMLRPPQPAVFLFVFDVSFNAIETGYLHSICRNLKENLEKMPGDSRTMIGFITFDSKIHFYSLRPKSTQPQMYIVSDLDDVFLPAPDDLLVNLKENTELVHQLLDSLPTMFSGTHNVHSATGAAMQAALKLVGPTGGRVSLFQTTLPNIGPGELKRREEPNQKSNPKDVVNLAPATDFYKKFALDCAAEQVAIDLFLLSTQYADISSLMCASKYSGGCVAYYPDFHVVRNPIAVEKFEAEFIRYLTRKIGFEAVMRVRCTRGLTIHTFHGNFFVRSTDLVSLPNINPDTGFTMQIDIEDNLTDSNIVCMQSALLYTSSKGERRIRVHTLAMPTTTKLSDVYAHANQQAIATLLAKMAVDRTLSSSLGDAREALMNACIDFLLVFRQSVANQPQSSNLLAPFSLRLLPLYILALLKHLAFRLGSTARLDERCFAMQQFKTMPVSLAMLTIYPSLYPIHDISDENGLHTKSGVVPQPPCLNLSAEKLSRQGVFLMDTGHAFYIWVGKDTPNDIIQQLFNVPGFNNIAENMGSLPELDNVLSQRVRCFIDYLQSQRTCHAVIHVFREDSRNRMLFLSNLVDDRAESVMSYYEFLVHLQRQVNK